MQHALQDANWLAGVLKSEIWNLQQCQHASLTAGILHDVTWWLWRQTQLGWPARKRKA